MSDCCWRNFFRAFRSCMAFFQKFPLMFRWTEHEVLDNFDVDGVPVDSRDIRPAMSSY